MVDDRRQLRRLERKVYLQSLRSYRLSGLVCNDHLDKSLPKVASEPAFNCLPTDYKKKACMFGRAEYPISCSKYRPQGQSAQDFLQKKGPYVIQTIDQDALDCDLPATTCTTSDFVGSPLQLPPGMLEANVMKRRSDGRVVWTKESIKYIMDMIHNGKDISPGDYPGSHPALERALKFARVQNRRILVFGSISPWVEALALTLGATPPTMTVDYNPPVSTDDRFGLKQMEFLLNDFDLWPVIISYSSIEHDGQGRYGDPLDPDGDLAAMQEVWLKLQPGGVFVLGVPLGMDTFHWFSQREYGPARLPLLTSGWEYGGLATTNRIYLANETFLIKEVKDCSPVLVLHKPKSSVVRGGIDRIDTASGGLQCSPEGMCSRKLL